MRKPVPRLLLASFAPSTHCDSLREAVTRLGYELCAVNGDKWLEGDADGFSLPTILLLGQKNHEHDKILSVLEQADKARIVAVFTCDQGHWDERVLNRCSDFVGWPCHPDELALRIERAFDGVGSIGEPGEPEILEKFVGLTMLGASSRFTEAIGLIRKFARCDAPILIEGETGTGKELAARTIHYLGARRDYPFIPVSCGAMPDNLVENELFGHEKGAFTDAKDKQPGLVVQAQGGTLFLDEVDTLSAKAQVTLLRFLEGQEYKPLGSKRLKKANVRVLAATNSRLHELAEKRLFRQDLLFRLDVLSVHLPALRERHGDVRLLAEHFLSECSARYKQPTKILHPETLAWMERYTWPGNVRELENLMHRAFLLTEGPVIRIADKNLQTNGPRDPDIPKNFALDVGFSEAKANLIAEFEKSYLRWLMAETGGNITLAAKRAGKERRALGKLLKKHGIEKSAWFSDR